MASQPPGKRRFRSSQGRRAFARRLLILGLIVLILLGLAGGTVLGYAEVKTNANQLQADLSYDLQQAQQQLEQGKTTLEQANSKHDAGLAAQAATEFQKSRATFAGVAKKADGSQLLRYVELVPSVGESVHAKHLAVDLISDMGAQLSEAGLQLATLDQNLIKPSSAGSAGKSFLSVINETSAQLNGVRADLIQAQSDASRVDLGLLPGGQRATLLKARDSIDAGIQALNEFARLAPVLVDIVGGNGTRRYLIEQTNPAELRAGGGFIGSYSLIEADHGTISVVKSGNAYDLVNPRPLPGQHGFIPQPTPYRQVIPDVSWSFVDSNIYPDFPSNAKIGMQFVEPRLGKVDGVIAIDYYTVADMLSLTGPISLPSYGITVTSKNFVSEAMRLDLTQGSTQKFVLAALAGPLMSKIATLPAAQWPSLVTAMNQLAAQRHLQAYFVNAAVEAEIDRVGWSGTLNPTNAAEFFMELEDNYYGNKDNYFINRHYTITLTRQGNLLHQTVEVDLLNRTPANASERVLYKGVIRVYVHGGMSAPEANLQRVVYANPTPPAGFGLIDGWIFVQCCGGKGAGVLQFNRPWTPDASGRESIYWQKQPGTTGDSVTVVWDDGAGHKFSASGDLSGDRVITVSPTGVQLAAGQAGSAVLPSLSLG